MNAIDRFDWGTPLLVYRPPISTNDSYTIEKFDILEQAELYAAMVDGEVYEHILTDYIGDDTKTLVYESSTGRRLRVQVSC
jgi:hypothetical protein